MITEYMLEKTLAQLSPSLHDRYRSCVVVSNQMLSRYEGIFPDYTDHTALHTLEIIDYCNALIGDQISRLSADAIYVLLMGAVFHDVGMGVSQEDFSRFLSDMNLSEPVPKNMEEIRGLTRGYHHELSGWYVRKYWRLFDIPNEAYAKAIIQICRGHRSVDLFDPVGYPAALPVEDGRTVPLPFLAALVRLSDEMDIACDRNFTFLYNPVFIGNSESRFEFLKHQSIHQVSVLPDRLQIVASTADPLIYNGILETAQKLSDTLAYCRRAVAERTEFAIRQTKVDLDITALWEE